MTCRRQKARTLAKPAPPPLPAEGVQWQRPFATVGVDHTGHFYAQDPYSNRIKLYICLFVCATTRAVHLEVVDNLSATSFIMYLRHLAAAKGIPSVILSDNHRTFNSGEKFCPTDKKTTSFKNLYKIIASHGSIRHRPPFGWAGISKSW